MITGDLTHLGEVTVYGTLADIIKGLPFPCHLLLGNHDGRKASPSVFGGVPTTPGGHVQQALGTPVGLFVVFDMNEAGTHSGKLGEERRARLSATLEETTDQFSYFCITHRSRVESSG